MEGVPESGDASEEVLEKEMVFLSWLQDNGAQLDSLIWPARDTASGMRGAVAKCDIQAGAPMFEIPLKLMIYVNTCVKCKDLADIYKIHSRFFESDDDLVIALFLMHEKLKAEDSFWAPYINMLPRPCGVADWSYEEQMFLQDATLVGQARRRDHEISQLHKRLSAILLSHDPSKFSTEKYSLELFTWAWLVIQSRAFGRSLPWTALVPFADCLNHINVQTKYDLWNKRESVKLKKDDEDMDACLSSDHVYFRLYPTGENSYSKGREVFNSYGRRSNRFLLLEYGFCLECNEWDAYDIFYRVQPNKVTMEEQRAVLRQFCVPAMKSFKLTKNGINLEFLAFVRFSLLDAHQLADCSFEKMPSSKSLCIPWIEPLSLIHEIQVVDAAGSYLQSHLDDLPTSIRFDQDLLADASLSFRNKMALVYRIGRKLILLYHIEALEKVMNILSGKKASETHVDLMIYRKFISDETINSK